MDTALKKDSFMNYQMLWSGSVGGEASIELVVPDSMPDIGVLLDADAVVSIRSKDADTGHIHAVTELSIKVLYQPEEDGILYSLPVNMNCDISAAVPDADLNCQTVFRLRLRLLEAKAINSRKLSVHAELSGNACCLRREEISMVKSISLPGVALQTLPQTRTACVISDVREKTFVVTDDYSLPGGCEDLSSILLQRVLLQPEGSEFVNGKLVFRGKARVFLLLACSDEIRPCYFETGFSQIMEVSGSPDFSPDISYILTGAFFDLPEHSGGKISAELHVLAQVIAREERTLEFIADLYSNQKALEPVFESKNYCATIHEVPQSRSLSGNADLPPEAASVLYAKGNVSNIGTEKEGIAVSVTAKVIYRRRDNSYSCANLRLKENFETLISEKENMEIVSVSVGESFASLSGSQLELRVPVQINALASTDAEITHVCDIRESEAQQHELPSVTLISAEVGEDLWSLAKKYGSSCEAILQANNGREEGLLLIPKAR